MADDEARQALAPADHHRQLRVLRLVGLALRLPARRLHALEPALRRPDRAHARAVEAQAAPRRWPSPATSACSATSSTTTSSSARRTTWPTWSALGLPLGDADDRAAGRDLVLHLHGDQLRRRHLPARLRAGRRSADFAAYLSFFPHLVAGPIVRGRSSCPQMETPRDPRARRLEPRLLPDRDRAVQEGRDRQLPGGAHRRPGVRRAGHATRRSEILVATYAYAVQIYADFSGYTDMAIGLALLLGFDLPAELRLAVRGRLAAGLLAALAHDALALAARLPLHPARRQPEGPLAHVP